MYYLRTKAATDAIKFTVDKKYKTETIPAQAESTMAVATAAAYAVEPAMVEPQAAQLTMDMPLASAMSAEDIARNQAAISCSLDNPDACEMCSG
jgi:ribonucleoside-diphosphate reductase alpha chain